jgi:hypothetical protein
MFTSVVAIVKVIILNEEVMVNTVHKSEVEIINMEKVKGAIDHLSLTEPKDLRNLKEVVDHFHLLQKEMIRHHHHHRNKTNDSKRH